MVTSEIAGACVPRFSATGEHFTVCLDDGSVELREREDGRTVRAFHTDEGCRDALLRSDGEAVLAVGTAGDVHVFSLDGRDPGASFALGKADLVALSPDGAGLLAADYRGPVRQWDVAARREERRVESPCGEGETRALAFGGEGTSFWVSCAQGTLARFDRATGKLTGTSLLPKGAIAISDPPGGPRAAVGWNPGASLYVLGDDGRPTAEVPLGETSTASFSSDGRALGLAYVDRVAVVDVPGASRRLGLPGAMSAISVASGVQALVACGGGAVLHSSLRSGSELHQTSAARVQNLVLGRASTAPELRVFGKRGLVLLRPDADKPVARLLSGEPISIGVPTDFEIERLGSDGERLLVQARFTPGLYAVVSASDAQRLGDITLIGAGCVHCPEHQALFASRDLGFLAIVTVKSGARSVERIDTRHGWQKVGFALDPRDDFPEEVELSSDGARLVVRDRERVAVWDVERRARSAGFSLAQVPHGIALASDDSALVVLQQSGGFEIVDLGTGRSMSRVERGDPGHPGTRLRHVLQGPGGKRVLLGDDRGSWWVWDPASGAGVGELFLFSEGAWAARDAQGRFAATTAALWRLRVVRNLEARTVSPETLVGEAQMLAALGLE